MDVIFFFQFIQVILFLMRHIFENFTQLTIASSAHSQPVEMKHIQLVSNGLLDDAYFNGVLRLVCIHDFDFAATQEAATVGDDKTRGQLPA
jgi:hypothetical protein